MERVENTDRNLSNPINDDRYVPPNIMRLPGITLDAKRWDFEKCAEQKFLAEVNADVVSDERPYDKIPRVFTTLAEWPECTNLRCWSCGFNFDGQPKFVPTYITLKHESESGKAEIEIGVKGNMCTFNCAELWIETNSSSREEQWRWQDGLLILYFLFTGRLISKIAPAPRITEHQMYGGELDHDAFWKKLRELDPAFGLKNHTLGSTIAERNRIGQERSNEIALSLKHRGVSSQPMRPVKFKRGKGGAAAACAPPTDDLDALLGDLLG